MGNSRLILMISFILTLVTMRSAALIASQVVQPSSQAPQQEACWVEMSEQELKDIVHRDRSHTLTEAMPAMSQNCEADRSVIMTEQESKEIASTRERSTTLSGSSSSSSSSSTKSSVIPYKQLRYAPLGENLDGVTDLAVLPTGELISSHSADVPTIYLWDLKKAQRIQLGEKLLKEQTDLKAPTYLIAVLSKNRIALSFPESSLICVLDLSTNDYYLLNTSGKDTAFTIKSMKALPDDTLAVGCGDGSIRIINTAPTKNASSVTCTLTPPSQRPQPTGLSRLFTMISSTPITSLAVLADNKLAAGADDGSIKIWNLTNKQYEQTLMGRPSENSTCLVPFKHFLISGSAEGSIQVWNLTEKKPTSTRTECGYAISCLTQYNNILATGMANGAILIWQIDDDGKLDLAQGIVDAHKEHVSKLITAGNMLISGSLDGSIKIWV
jgi:WD40 repeat protein